ncbi:MAG: hypothetical protein JWO70_2583 [Betaproteobacteria bacterium]|nr:hypothetical protein [Betaproteobacteria bacterium]
MATLLKSIASGPAVAALRFIGVVAVVGALMACTARSDTAEQGVTDDMKRITSDQWATLTHRTIYFGHQSLGANVVDGVRALLQQRPDLKLQISSGKMVASAGVLNEFPIGENTDPESKNAAMLDVARGELGPDPVLLFKYCFIDVDEKTDAAALFRRYQETVAALHARQPRATVVHATMPLTTDSLVRNWVNKLRGRPTRWDRNAVRARYNELLLATYRGKEPIFDIAAIESTRSDGTREYTSVGGKPVYALAAEWASDEGHLNAQGQRRAAEQLLITLAALPGAKAPAPQ